MIIVVILSSYDMQMKRFSSFYRTSALLTMMVYAFSGLPISFLSNTVDAAYQVNNSYAPWTTSMDYNFQSMSVIGNKLYIGTYHTPMSATNTIGVTDLSSNSTTTVA